MTSPMTTKRFNPTDSWVVATRCPCGWSSGANNSYLRRRHAQEHLDWAEGIPVPPMWSYGPLIRVDGISDLAVRKIAYQLALLFRRERGYTFSLLPPPAVWKRYPTQPRAYVAVQGSLAIALAIVGEAARWGWAIPDAEGYVHFDQTTPCLAIIGIFVCANYRRQGVARRLIENVAQIEGVEPAEIAWSVPWSEAGAGLVRSIAGDRPRCCGHVEWR